MSLAEGRIMMPGLSRRAVALAVSVIAFLPGAPPVHAQPPRDRPPFTDAETFLADPESTRGQEVTVFGTVHLTPLGTSYIINLATPQGPRVLTSLTNIGTLVEGDCALINGWSS